MNEYGISEWAKIIADDALAGLDPRDWRGSKTKIVYNDPAGWAEACRRATVGLDVEVHRVACAFLMIENLNGQRRVPNPDGGVITSLLEEIQQQINMISADHPRRARLQELHDYHDALCAGLTGQFAKSVQYQQQAAAKATDEWAKTIARYLAARESLNHALVERLPLQPVFNDFSDQVEFILSMFQGQPDDPERIRWRINVLINWGIYNRLIFYIVPGGGSSAGIAHTLDLLEGELGGVPANLQATMAGGLRCLGALRAMTADYFLASQIAAEPLPDVQDPEWVALPLLIQAYCLRQFGRQEESEAAAAKLEELNWGCHLAQAIARQLGYIQ